ncbi:MAG TPA: 16S rRNA processing protein RimM, partial [Candidatus Latescibacteria bacterium]|nr:16S rRNA processing protein RimM [Candidatus Latescibacterota bacterium]
MRKLLAVPSPTNPGHQSQVSPNEDDVVVGRIRGPRGLKGELHVEPLTDVATRFSPGSTLYLDGQPTRVERSRSVKNGLVVKLDAANDRTAAESLRQKHLTIPASEVAPLPESAYYHFQIIDMGVWTDEGQFLGDVKEIIPTGSNDVYVVRDEERRETLVPALVDVVLNVDVERNRMTVRMP